MTNEKHEIRNGKSPDSLRETFAVAKERTIFHLSFFNSHFSFETRLSGSAVLLNGK
jgi:hypothetical protein